MPYANHSSFGVTLGNGERIYGEGECQQVQIIVQGYNVCENFLVLELGSSDMILGVQWLEKLGEVMTNWKE